MKTWQKPPDGKISDNFSYSEAACRCCGQIVDLETIHKTAAMLEHVRKLLGDRPIKVLSWCRCPKHNRAVGGVPNSFHIHGMAVDFVVKDLPPQKVQEILKNVPGGLGCYPGFTHIDSGPKRRF